MKKIVMTGATSFLGRSVIRELAGEKCQISAFVRPESANQKLLPAGDQVKIFNGCLEEIERALSVISEGDVFLHFAWAGTASCDRGQEDIQRENIVYAGKALEAARRMGCRKFIFPGSQAEYGIRQDLTREEDLVNPVSAYGKAKAEFGRQARLLCEDGDMDFYHLRVFSVYGYGDRSGTLTDLCMRRFLQGEHVSLGSCEQKWNYLYIDDFARIVREFIFSDCAPGVYNVASDDTRRLKDFVNEMHRLSGMRGSFDHEASVVKPEGIANLNPDISKLRRNLPEIRFTSFSAGARETMEKIKQEITQGNGVGMISQADDS